VSKSARLEHRRQRQEAEARRRELARQRKRIAWAASAIALVVVVFGVLVAVKLAAKPAPAPVAAANPAPSEVANAVTAVPASVLNTVGLGKVDTLPKPISGQPALTADGKPLVVYIGAEYCPYCAAQRWGVAVALARFGSFTNLGTTTSAADDAFPNTATLDFHGTGYTSQYLSFQGVETQTNVKSGSGYGQLDTPTAQQSQLMATYDAPPYVSSDAAGSIPFIDIANKFVLSGASISPSVLAGKNAIDIATALKDPTSPIAQAIDGAANAFTAAFCEATGGQPGDVCTGAGVTAYTSKLHAG
jgi:uncharacterized membrane protein (DUF485 family)